MAPVGLAGVPGTVIMSHCRVTVTTAVSVEPAFRPDSSSLLGQALASSHSKTLSLPVGGTAGEPAEYAIREQSIRAVRLPACAARCQAHSDVSSSMGFFSVTFGGLVLPYCRVCWIDPSALQ